MKEQQTKQTHLQAGGNLLINTASSAVNTSFWKNVDKVLLLKEAYNSISKLDGVAPLVTDPPSANFTTMQTLSLGL